MSGPGGGTPQPGLQNERTALSWQRTALAIALVGALLLKSAVMGMGSPAAWVGWLALATAAVIGTRTGRLYRRRGQDLQRDGEGQTGHVPIAQPAGVAACTLVVVGLGMAALLVIATA